MNGIRRPLQYGLGLVVMSTMLGLLAACGNETTNQAGEDTNTDKPTATETTQAGDQAALSELPEFPPAPRDAGNPRLRGSQEMTYEEFLHYVVNDASAKWQGTLADVGISYSPVGFYPYDEAVETECGTLDQASGPAYCSIDETIFFPLEWINPNSGQPMMESGDFAMATVAAHEVGHHVQQQLGILEDADYTNLQTELQADCFAGVWGYSAYYEGLVESGDIDEAMSISWESGDLPEQPRGGPGAHGTPEERVEAFLTGYDYGDPVRCLNYTPPSEGTTATASPEATTGG